MLFKIIYLTVVILFLSLINNNQNVALANNNELAGLPADAVEYLKSLPGQAVSLDMVVGRSLRAADSFKEVAAEAGNIDVPLLSSRAATQADPVLSLSGAYFNDKNEQLNDFAPQRTLGKEYSVNYAQRLSSGTQLNVKVAHGSTDIQFNNSTFNAFGYQTRLTLGISQDLWQDAFGYGTRRQREAGTLNKVAAFHAYGIAVENYVSQLINIYYNAWLAQAQTRAAEEGLKRRERLLQITRVKFNRGTSEEPDLLQVQSARINAEIHLSQARQALQDIWRELIMTLKLPERWMEIDAIKIPMVIDQPQEFAGILCGSPQQISAAPATSKAVEQLTRQSEADELSYEAAKNALAPQTRLNLEYDPNGIDNDSRSTTLSDAFTNDNPRWTAGLSLTIPIGNSAARSQLYSASVKHEKSQAHLSRAKADLKVAWSNTCSNFFRLEDNRSKLQSNFDKQSRRAVLEERRFNIGRSSALNIIQAGDDATSAELSYNQAQANVRLAAWEVQRIAGKIDDYINRLKTQYEAAQGQIPAEPKP